MKILYIMLCILILSGFSNKTSPEKPVLELIEEGSLCVYHEPESFNFYRFIENKGPASAIAQEKFNMLCETAGENPGDYELYSSPGMNNAYAYNDGVTKEVVYDPYFLSRIDNRQGTTWAGYSVIAHELGHHVRGMGVYTRHESELQADEYSGYVLGLQGATLEEAQAGISMIGTFEDTDTHPSKSRRLARIKKGWLKAQN